MKTVSAKDAKQGFGDMLTTAMHEPVAITKNGKPAAVLLSHRDYLRFEAIEDMLWTLRADAVMSKGDFLSAEETANFIREALERAGS